MKWYGRVGYAIPRTPESGIHVEDIVTKPYFGDSNKFARRINIGNEINPTMSVSNEISIVSDPFAIEHFANIRFVEFMGNFWEVTFADALYPRINLTLGGLYNGRTS